MDNPGVRLEESEQENGTDAIDVGGYEWNQAFSDVNSRSRLFELRVHV